MAVSDPSPRRLRAAEHALHDGLGTRGWQLLSRAEREAEIRSIAADFSFSFSAAPPPPDAADREGWIRRLRTRVLLPVLPPWGPRCELCLTPARLRGGLCSSCRALTTVLGRPLSTLEFVTMAATDDRAHDWIRWWKDAAAETGAEAAPPEYLHRVAVSLSAYLEAQAPRLLARQPVVTAVPTHAPVVSAALERAGAFGWYAPAIVPTGTKAGDW